MKVLVVGAGPAGLATAFGLVERGADVTIVEGAPHVGGRMRTLHVDSHAIELGPAGILDDGAETQALLAQLGTAAPRAIAASPRVSRRYLLRGGRVRALPSGPLSLLFGNALTFGERLALLREPRVPRGTATNETVAAFARRRFGASLAQHLAQPMVVGVFGGDYEALELASAFPRLAEMESKHGSVVRGLRADAKTRGAEGRARPKLSTFEGGMGALPLALAARLDGRVRLSAELAAIDFPHGKPSATLRDGSRIDADHVVLTGAPDQSRGLLSTLDPALGELVGAIPASAIASVSLAWKRSELRHSLDGFGLLVPRGEGKKTIGVLFMTSIFPTAQQAPSGEVLLRVMMGGPNDPRIHELDDQQILDAARAEVGEMLGATGAPSFSHLQRWPLAIAQYTIGHAARAEEIATRAARFGVTLAGTSLHGVGVNDVIRDAARVVDRLVPR